MPKSNTTPRKAPGRGRDYTDVEDQVLRNWVKSHPHLRPTGVKIWELAVEHEILPDRPVWGMHDRYKYHLMNQGPAAVSSKRKRQSLPANDDPFMWVDDSTANEGPRRKRHKPSKPSNSDDARHGDDGESGPNESESESGSEKRRNRKEKPAAEKNAPLREKNPRKAKESGEKRRKESMGQENSESPSEQSDSDEIPPTQDIFEMDFSSQREAEKPAKKKKKGKDTDSQSMSDSAEKSADDEVIDAQVVLTWNPPRNGEEESESESEGEEDGSDQNEGAAVTAGEREGLEQRAEPKGYQGLTPAQRDQLKQILLNNLPLTQPPIVCKVLGSISANKQTTERDLKKAVDRSEDPHHVIKGDHPILKSAEKVEILRQHLKAKMDAAVDLASGVHEDVIVCFWNQKAWKGHAWTPKEDALLPDRKEGLILKLGKKEVEKRLDYLGLLSQ